MGRLWSPGRSLPSPDLTCRGLCLPRPSVTQHQTNHAEWCCCLKMYCTASSDPVMVALMSEEHRVPVAHSPLLVVVQDKRQSSSVALGREHSAHYRTPVSATQPIRSISQKFPFRRCPVVWLTLNFEFIHPAIHELHLPGQKIPSPSSSDHPIMLCIFLNRTSSIRIKTGEASYVNLIDKNKRKEMYHVIITVKFIFQKIVTFCL